MHNKTIRHLNENLSPKQVFQNYIRNNTSDICADVLLFYANMDQAYPTDTSNEEIRIFLYCWYRITYEMMFSITKHCPNFKNEQLFDCFDLSELFDCFDLSELFDCFESRAEENIPLTICEVFGGIEAHTLQYYTDSLFQLCIGLNCLKLEWRDIVIMFCADIGQTNTRCVDNMIHLEHKNGSMFDYSIECLYTLDQQTFGEIINEKNKINSDWKTLLDKLNIQLFL